jgi:hypothetical protein
MSRRCSARGDEDVGEAASLILSCRGVVAWLEVRPRSCHAEHGGRQCSGADFGKRAHTRSFRRSRRNWWRSLQRRGALVPWEILARVSTVDSEIQEKSPTSIWCASRDENMSGSCAGSRQEGEVQGEIMKRPELTEKWRCSFLTVAAR